MVKSQQRVQQNPYQNSQQAYVEEINMLILKTYMEMQKIQNDQNNTDFKIYHKSWQFLSSPKINKKYISTKYLQKNFQNSYIHKQHQNETIQTSINRIMDKPIVVCNRILVNNKKKSIDTYKNMDESHIYVDQKSQTQKCTYYIILFT